MRKRSGLSKLIPIKTISLFHKQNQSPKLFTCHHLSSFLIWKLLQRVVGIGLPILNSKKNFINCEKWSFIIHLPCLFVTNHSADDITICFIKHVVTDRTPFPVMQQLYSTFRLRLSIYKSYNYETRSNFICFIIIEREKTCIIIENCIYSLTCLWYRRK